MRLAFTFPYPFRKMTGIGSVVQTLTVFLQERQNEVTWVVPDSADKPFAGRARLSTVGILLWRLALSDSCSPGGVRLTLFMPISLTCKPLPRFSSLC